MAKREQDVTGRDLEQLSSLFRLLSDRTRLSILLCLAKGERNVTSLCEKLKLPQPTISHHLGLLRMNNIVGCRRHGKQVYYSVNGSAEHDAQSVMYFAVQKLGVYVRPRVRQGRTVS